MQDPKTLIGWVLWILRFDRNWVLLATKHINVWQVMVGVESSAFLPQWRNCHVNSILKYPFSAVSSLAPLVLYFNNIWPPHPCYRFVLFLQKINIYSVCCVNFSWPSVCRGNFLHYSSVTCSEKQAISMRCCNSSLQGKLFVMFFGKYLAMLYCNARSWVSLHRWVSLIPLASHQRIRRGGCGRSQLVGHGMKSRIGMTTYTWNGQSVTLFSEQAMVPAGSTPGQRGAIGPTYWI